MHGLMQVLRRTVVHFTCFTTIGCIIIAEPMAPRGQPDPQAGGWLTHIPLFPVATIFPPIVKNTPLHHNARHGYFYAFIAILTQNRP
jgi:hypothetical protein